MNRKLILLPVVLYLMMVFIIINGTIDLVFQYYEINLFTLWSFRVLACYSIIAPLILYFYDLIQDERRSQENGKTKEKKL